MMGGRELASTPAKKRGPVIVGISGSSGAVLACRIVEVLGDLGVPMHITYTPACRQVWPDEIGRVRADDLEDWKRRFGARVFNPDYFRAPMPSGMYLSAGNIGLPLSALYINDLTTHP